MDQYLVEGSSTSGSKRYELRTDVGSTKLVHIFFVLLSSDRVHPSSMLAPFGHFLGGLSVRYP
jgi:hypothetical protein